MPFLGESSILFGGFTGPTAGYVPAGAIWLDSGDYLSRTLATPTDADLLFMSMWIKKADFGSQAALAEAFDGATLNLWRFMSTDQMNYRYGASERLQTSQVFRDPTGWMHVAMQHNSNASGGSGDYHKFWVNGTEVTAFGTDSPVSAGDDCILNKASQTLKLFRDVTNNADNFIGYVADVVILDGQEEGVDFNITDLCTTDANGNPIPVNPGAGAIDFSGANSAWLDFADSADLGNDVSGNNNDFTPTSMSAANSTNDNPADDADTGQGNYAKVSKLFTREQSSYSSPAGNITVSNAGQTVFFDNGGTNPLCITTQVLQPGKKYHFEWETDAWGSDSLTFAAVWLVPLSTLLNRADINSSGGKCYYIPSWNPSRGIGASTNFNASNLTSMSAGDAWNVGEVLSLDIDMSTIGSTNIIAKLDGTTVATDSSLAFNDEPYVICPQVQSNSTNRTWKGTYNFGDSDFATTPEADHVGVSTLSYDAPTVTDPSAYFKAVTYTGTGSARSVTGVGFQPDFVWVKNRDSTDSHVITDVIRGVQAGIFPDATAPEYSDANYLTSFDSDGFSVGSQDAFNALGENIVAWCMKAGGSGSSNTDGSVTSTVSVADHNGFAIIKHTNTSGDYTVGHGMGQAPDMLIQKGLGTQGWLVWTKDLAADGYLELHSTSYQVNTTGDPWSDTIPTSSVFTIAGTTWYGGSSFDIVTYAFARTPGLIGIGSYIGNGSTDGPYVVVDDGGSGFRPGWIVFKNASGGGFHWLHFDAVRNTYNPLTLGIQGSAGPEGTAGGTFTIDFTSNGFKVRGGAGEMNYNGHTIIYLAFAEYPFGGEGISQARAR